VRAWERGAAPPRLSSLLPVMVKDRMEDRLQERKKEKNPEAGRRMRMQVTHTTSA
jgi:hypothetical protein